MSAPAAAGSVAAGLVLAMAVLGRTCVRVARRLPVRARLPRGRQPGRSAARAGLVPPAALEEMARAAGHGAALERWWTRWLAGLVVGSGVLLLRAGPALATGGAVLWVVVPLVLLRARRGRHREALDAALPGVLEDVARGLRGGLALPVAVARTAGGSHGPWEDHLRSLAEALERGAGLAGELQRWGRTQACSGLSLAVAALALGADAGGPQARAIDGVAGTLRDRAAVRAEQQALSSQARASALVMAVTPLAFAALAAVTDPRTGDFLLHSTAGAGCLVGGGLLDLAAAAWMIRISDGSGGR